MTRKKFLYTSLTLGTIFLISGSTFYSIVNADTTGSADVTYKPGDTPIPGDGWEIIIPTSYEFTAGNNPTEKGKAGQAVEGSVRLADPYGNTYNGDKVINVTVTSINSEVLKDANGNGNATYQLQDGKGTLFNVDGTSTIASLEKGKDNVSVNAALTKSERSKGIYSDILTFKATEKIN